MTILLHSEDHTISEDLRRALFGPADYNKSENWTERRVLGSGAESQYFLFAKPMPLDEVERFLKNSNQEK